MSYDPADIRVSIDRARASLRIANAAIVTMTRRAMDRGQGVDDSAHQTYSRRYAQQKGHTGHVDLTVTGRMRRSIRAEMSGPDAVVRLRGPGKPDYAVYVNRKRPWFGLSRDDRETLRPIVRRVLRQSMAQPRGS